MFRSGPTALTLGALTVPMNFPLRVERVGGNGSVFITLDGTDPRAVGGAARGNNVGAMVDLSVTTPMVVSARTLHNGEWSPLHRLRVTVLSELPVEIHEFLASNTIGLRDEAGERDDWIEILNRGTTSIDLGGYHLTDDAGLPTKWQLPGGTVVPAGGTLLVWADDQVTQGPLHANFRLSASGEALALFDPSGTFLVDGVQFGPQASDVAWGRIEGLGRTWVALATPTPRQPNQATPCGHITYAATTAPRLPITLQGVGSVTPGEQWMVRLRTPLPAIPVAFLVGMQPVHFSLGAVGTLLVNPLFVVPAFTDAEGQANLNVTLPSHKTVRQQVLCVQALVPVGTTIVLTDAVTSCVCP